MLLELSIKDFAIIDELRVGFERGFNALTGETGAGKSIIIDALGAVLGERVGSDVVRSGAKAARVEATFDVSDALTHGALESTLAELGVEADDGILILGREVTATGRSSARVNGRASTAGTLARIGAVLVDIHGQSDHLTLLRPGEHLDILDRYAGVTEDRAKVSRLVKDLRELRSQIAAIATGARERAQRLDLLRFQVQEIEAAAPEPGEDDELLAERRVLVNAERLATAANAAFGLINGDDDAFGASGGVIAALRQAQGHLQEIASVDETMRDVSGRLDEVVILLQDVMSDVRSYRDEIEADPARLDVIEYRIEILKRLKRKYGATIADVITHGQDAARELDGLTGGEAGIEGLRERETEVLRSIEAVATRLSAARRDAGQQLSREVEATIAELNMGRSRFAVEIVQVDTDDGVPFSDESGTERRVAVDGTGVDRVQFLLAANAGESLKPLGRVASGGETARLMLALKSTLSRADATPTLVFDEVDVGVGGRSGQVVGEKLWMLADGHQVLVITHLPQIAAFADAHFQIAKAERDGRVVSQIDALEPDERIDELAAMLDGMPVTAAAQASAVEMLTRVTRWRESARSTGVQQGAGIIA